MSGFGGFCPLPLRLGGDALTGWTAAEHARAAADLSACATAAVFARITVTLAAGVLTVHAYQGINGVGLTHAPEVTTSGTGIIDLAWERNYEDEFGVFDSVAIRTAQAQIHGTAMAAETVQIVSANAIKVRLFNAAGAAADGKVTISVTGWSRVSRIGHYDGATDKEDTKREGAPYAWLWYNEYTAALGSGFTTAQTGLVHSMKLALARLEASVQRGAEKINANSHPGTADDMLGEWIRILKLRLRGDETRQEIRQRAAAKFKATLGSSRTNVDRVTSELLGPYFIQNYRTIGTDLDNPPPLTTWPGVHPGTPTYSMGGGSWFSERAHLTVSVNGPRDINDAQFSELMNVELYNELDRLLPAWMTFNWAVFTSGGFLLDISKLDFEGLT